MRAAGIPDPDLPSTGTGGEESALSTLRWHQPPTTQSPNPQITPTATPTKIKVHRQPLNSVSMLSLEVAHRTAGTAIAPKRAAKTKVLTSTTLLPPKNDPRPKFVFSGPPARPEQFHRGWAKA